jgi:hypothetical protein
MRDVKKMEYRISPSAGLPTEDQLNELAAEGWEVVQIVQNLASRDRFEYAVYLRRAAAAAADRSGFAN